LCHRRAYADDGYVVHAGPLYGRALRSGDDSLYTRMYARFRCSVRAVAPDRCHQRSLVLWKTLVHHCRARGRVGACWMESCTIEDSPRKTWRCLVQAHGSAVQRGYRIGVNIHSTRKMDKRDASLVEKESVCSHGIRSPGTYMISPVWRPIFHLARTTGSLSASKASCKRCANAVANMTPVREVR